MGLGIQTEAGAFSSYIKMDARSGRILRKKNVEKGEQSDVDITDGFLAVFDMAGIEVGWAMFAAGAAPAYVMQSVAAGLPPKPQGDFKQGFRVNVALPATLGGGIYELASTAKAIIGSIDKLHNEYEAAPESKAGKLPVVKLNGTQMVETKTPQGVNRNYSPVLAIVGWVDRPASMQEKAATTTATPAPTAAPPATGSTQVAPPAAKPAAAPADMAFG